MAMSASDTASSKVATLEMSAAEREFSPQLEGLRLIAAAHVGHGRQQPLSILGEAVLFAQVGLLGQLQLGLGHFQGHSLETVKFSQRAFVFVEPIVGLLQKLAGRLLLLIDLQAEVLDLGEDGQQRRQGGGFLLLGVEVRLDFFVDIHARSACRPIPPRPCPATCGPEVPRR